MIHVPQPDTAQRRLKASIAPGRPWHRVAGGWIADKISLRKFICLCSFCDHKFNPKKNDYELWRRNTYLVATCDGCEQHDPRCKAFIHQSYHDEIGDIRRTRRRGRWAS